MPRIVVGKSPQDPFYSPFFWVITFFSNEISLKIKFRSNKTMYFVLQRDVLSSKGIRRITFVVIHMVSVLVTCKLQ